MTFWTLRTRQRRHMLEPEKNDHFRIRRFLLQFQFIQDLSTPSLILMHLGSIDSYFDFSSFRIRRAALPRHCAIACTSSQCIPPQPIRHDFPAGDVPNQLDSMCGLLSHRLYHYDGILKKSVGLGTRPGGQD
mgnify:CR=1 FL=1